MITEASGGTLDWQIEPIYFIDISKINHQAMLYHAFIQ